jgi:hypothetical protein
VIISAAPSIDTFFMNITCCVIAAAGSVSDQKAYWIVAQSWARGNSLLPRRSSRQSREHGAEWAGERAGEHRHPTERHRHPSKGDRHPTERHGHPTE